jgi:peroxiredoxin
MIGSFRWLRSERSAAPAAASRREEGPTVARTWRRHLTMENLFFIAVLLVLAFFLARRQGYFLDSPSVEPGSRSERDVVAPEFVLPALDGPPVRLSDHRGKVVLLNFWATWCPPCRAEMPSMEKLYQGYRDRGLTILAISSEVSGRTVVEPFVRERGLTFPILLNPEGDVFAQYGVRGLPTSFVLDRQGRIVSAEIGARDWSSGAAREGVERLLAESGAAALSRAH